jgi:hypothetical protein
MPARCKHRKSLPTVDRGKMKTSALLSLFLSQLVLCEKSPFIPKYDCATHGIPAVAVIAGQGPNTPSVEFFLPMFDNCSAAEVRKPAQLTAGGLCSLWHPSTPDTKQAPSLWTMLCQEQQALLSLPMLPTRMDLPAVSRLCSSDASSRLSLFSV